MKGFEGQSIADLELLGDFVEGNPTVSLDLLLDIFGQPDSTELSVVDGTTGHLAQISDQLGENQEFLHRSGALGLFTERFHY
jgi:hypothetical protein